ncbi:MAG: hypothetical protein EXS67_04220 [Candidatus Margulisbacteria bacterium]|nr:hypothetical protein [Candidatus Margulisiibacteriota bacterium]
MIKIREIIGYLSDNIIFVDPEKIKNCVVEDKNDWAIIGTALAAKVKIIVTGDKGILKHKKVNGIAILSPREFWERLSKR